MRRGEFRDHAQSWNHIHEPPGARRLGEIVERNVSITNEAVVFFLNCVAEHNLEDDPTGQPKS